MSLFTPLSLEAAPQRARKLLEDTQAQLGRIPNLYAAMANSPAALQSYLAFRAALQDGALAPRMREYVALLTAELNQCGYCVAAHSFRLGKMGDTAAAIAAVRRAASDDPRTAAALAFVRELVLHRGAPRPDALTQLHQAGWSEAEIGELVAHVALNVFSNYFNHVGRPPLDFPAVALPEGGEDGAP